jgi:peptidyl-prolyl cis-trans isomerase A (cyclophilin A)
LTDPSKATETAPASYKAKFETTKGEFVVKLTREWAPIGADRFYNLVKIGYFDNAAFFRTVKGFMVQFGISGYPEASAAWRQAKIKDDPNKQSNTKGRITFATSGTDSRTTQVFINYGNNDNLDGMGFSPFGEVESGLEVLDALYGGYGDGPPRGRGPNQGLIQAKGNSYLKESFPELDYIKKATILP